jgi:ribose transport system substrate-binding protein
LACSNEKFSRSGEHEIVIVRRHGRIANTYGILSALITAVMVRIEPITAYDLRVATTPSIVVSLLTQDNDYQVEQAASAEEAARNLGVGVQILYADNDSILQSQQILKFIQGDPELRPDGIILEPVGGTGLPQVAKAAVDAGIAWIVLNREVGYVRQLRQSCSAPVFSLASDNQEIGRIQGLQFGRLLPKGGTVLYIQGPSDTDAAKLRMAGMLETKPASVQIKTIKAQWTEASAFKAINNWLQLSTSQRAQIDVISAQNDAMAAGARKAFQQFTGSEVKDHWSNLPFLGVDGVPKTGQAWVRQGLLTATIISPPLAGRAVEMLIDALRRGKFPVEVTLIEPRSYPPLETLHPSSSHQKRSTT